MKIGKFQIDVIDTGLFALDGGAMFGVVPKPLWAKAYNSGDEANRIPLAAKPILIRWDDKKVLIDTGNGTKFPEKLANIYNIDLEKSNIAHSLAKLNLKPDDITDVILTHLHFDHAGGATYRLGNDIAPTFPNAKYYVQQSHYNWALNPTDKDSASFFRDDFEPLIANGMLHFTDGDGEIFPGIYVFPVFGHTQAMQLVKISGEGKTLLYLADLSPTAAHINIPYVLAYDNFPLTSIEEKKKYLQIAYEDNWMLFFEHDAFTDFGKLIQGKRGFEVEKIETF